MLLILIYKSKKSFGQGQLYKTFSGLQTFDNLYSIEAFNKSSESVNKDELLEYECLNQNDLFIFHNKKKDYFR